MYLYVELWKPKDAWRELTPNERRVRVDSMLRDAKKYPVATVIPFSFRNGGDAGAFDGVTEQPSVVDSRVARPTGFRYTAAWMIPTRELIQTFEHRFDRLGWWFDFFEQENAWGVLDGAVTGADMIEGCTGSFADDFDGSYAGRERAGYCWCPAGTFEMGPDRTQVTLTQGFWMGKYEVTQELYRSVMNDNPSAFVGDQLPVDSLTREQSLQFCVLLNERERKAGRLPAGWEYNMPTEAQWEYAARAGTSTMFPWGDDVSLADDYSWHMFNSGSASHPVGQKKPNAWGLYDMLGNCLERCRDVWAAIYPGGKDPNVTPDDAAIRSDESDGRWGVCRGGGWFIPPVITARDRTRLGPGNQGYLLGLRIAIVRTTASALSGGHQALLEWGNSTMGHWASDPASAGNQGPGFSGSSSARWLRNENGLEGQFLFGGLKGNFVTMVDPKTDQITQHTVNTDGGSGQTVITKEGGRWAGSENAVYPNGSHASSIDYVTLLDGGHTMEHHITKREQNGVSLPDIQFVLRRVSN